MNIEAQPHIEDSSISKGNFLLLVAFIAVVFFFTNHSFQYSLVSEVRSFSDSTFQGNYKRQIVISFLGLFGIASLALTSRVTPKIRQDFTLSIALLSCWSILSIVWSDSPFLTARRLTVFIFLCLSALAISRRVRSEGIILLIFLVSSIILFVGIFSEFYLGTFNPLNSMYRFSGTAHANFQGINCALVVLSGLASSRIFRHLRWPFIGLSSIALIFLLLTKSRTSIFGLVVAILFARNLSSTTSRKVRFLFLSLTVILALLLVLGELFLPSLQTALLFGRDVEQGRVVQLAGRVPLFLEMKDYIFANPIFGYGYGAFWNPERIESISASQGWETAGSHSTYLDVGLDLGLIGLGLYILMFLKSERAARRVVRQSPNGVSIFFAGFIFLYLLHGFLESVFLAPGFPFFASMLVVLSIAREHGLAPTGFGEELSKHEGFDQVVQDPLRPPGANALFGPGRGSQ